MFYYKVVLRNFAKLTEKHLCQSLFFNKVAGLRLATLLKNRLWHSCFPVNFAKFLRTPFSQNTSSGCFYICEMVLFFCSLFVVNEISKSSGCFFIAFLVGLQEDRKGFVVTSSNKFSLSHIP